MLFYLLHDSRTINITTVILATFAGLYGYQGLLGRPGGLLRQLLVGIPMGVVLGIGNYLFDVTANNVLSNTLKELIQVPTIPISSITIGIIGFIGGLMWVMLFPNFFRQGTERQDASISTTVLYFLFAVTSGTLWNSIGIQAIFYLLTPWLGFHPPLLGVLVVAFLLALITIFYTNSQLGLMHPTNTTPKLTPLGCIFNLVSLIPATSLIIYFVSVVGWISLIYLGTILVTTLLVLLIQYIADHLKEKQLQVISLVVFLLAAALQLYQATAL